MYDVDLRKPLAMSADVATRLRSLGVCVLDVARGCKPCNDRDQNESAPRRKKTRQ